MITTYQTTFRKLVAAPFKTLLRALDRKVWVAALAVSLSVTGLTAQAQTGGTTGCVIASKDGQNTFRTDEISDCRINTANGNVSFVLAGQTRERTYDAVAPLTTRHLEAAAYWRDRIGRLRVPAATNPAGFDAQAFLSAAAQATHGFVLTRNKRNGQQAVNVVFVTDGVYRSIDFSGTDLRETPTGFLMTR